MKQKESQNGRSGGVNAWTVFYFLHFVCACVSLHFVFPIPSPLLCVQKRWIFDHLLELGLGEEDVFLHHGVVLWSGEEKERTEGEGRGGRGGREG